VAAVAAVDDAVFAVAPRFMVSPGLTFPLLSIILTLPEPSTTKAVLSAEFTDNTDPVFAVFELAVVSAFAAVDGATPV
jgi:hypothetical protein